MTATAKRPIPLFPCGATRPLSAKYPGYADARGVLSHYKTCQHPGCRARLDAVRKLGQEMAADMRAKQL